jgi:hypothetical protein
MGDIYATRQLLGHADVSTIANVYVQGSPADLEPRLRNVVGRDGFVAVGLDDFYVQGAAMVHRKDESVAAS